MHLLRDCRLAILGAVRAEHVKAGRLRALAVTGKTRSTVLPDVPTVAETVPGYEAIAWLVIAAPKDTPASVLETLNKSINAGLADPKVNQTIVEWGESP